jgi:outer membrane protein
MAQIGANLMRTQGFLAGVAAVGVLTLGLASSLEAQTAQGRIAFIDSQAILAEAPGAREAQEEFERQMENFSREIEQMETELESLITSYQQQQSTLVQSVREARESEIRQRDQRYQQRLEEMEIEAALSRQRLVEPILNRMSETIEQIRAEGSYAIIFDVQGQSIVAADPALDLTDEVLRRLQQTAESGQP